jgi:uncharacterized membrane protein
MENFKEKLKYRYPLVTAPVIRIVAKYLVIGCALTNLVLSPTYVNGLLKLENEICGFVMFLFILLGLVALFQASRYKGGREISLALNLLALVLVIALGLYLCTIFADALANQKTLKKPEDVQKALSLGYMMCSIYGIAFVLFVLQAFFEKREA